MLQAPDDLVEGLSPLAERELTDPVYLLLSIYQVHATDSSGARRPAKVFIPIRISDPAQRAAASKK
jgi:hypothetical protein